MAGPKESDPSLPTVVGGRRGSRPEGEPERPASPPPERYELGSEIARGGMGRVVDAFDTKLGRTVAFKEALADSEDALRRFRREIRITARLEHPSIVPVHDAGESANGSPFYVMRKVSGRPLEELVLAADTLAKRLALLPNLVATANAIAHAHRRGVIHRDIKPTNILIGDFGETVVIDWGLAKATGEPDDDDLGEPSALVASDSLRTRIGTVFGTPGFMPPEQIRGEPVGAGSDVYALGATLYYTLARKPPHAATSGDETLVAAERGPPEPLSMLVAGVPPELETIVDKALAYDPRVRYRDAGALAEDLESFLAGQLVGAHRYSRRERVMRFVRRYRAAFAIAGLAIVALAIGSWIAIGRVLDERDRADAEAELATRRQHDAELARAAEQDRADQLLLYQAQQLADTNPTAAVALVKQLATPPERWTKWWRHARAIAAESTAAGIARALPGPERASSVAISPGGGRALVVGIRGELWWYELAELRVHPLAGSYGESAMFAGDDRVIAYSSERISVVELATGARRVIATDQVDRATASAHAVYWLVGPTLWRAELPAGAATRIGTFTGPHFIRVSPDGAHLLVIADEGAYLVDDATPGRARKLVAGEVGPSTWSADSKRVAIGRRHQVGIVEISEQSTPIAWTTVPSLIGQPVFADPWLYLGDERGLQMIVPPGPHLTAETADNMLLFPAFRGRVAFANGNRISLCYGSETIPVVAPVERIDRFATSATSRYLVVAAQQRTFIYDLAAMFPATREFPGYSSFASVGAHDLVVLSPDTWAWIDVDAGITHVIGAVLAAGSMASIGGSPTTDDMLLVAYDHKLRRYRPGSPEPETIASDVRFAEIDDQVIALAQLGGTIVEYRLADKQLETVDHRQGLVVSIAGQAGWLAAMYSDGTVWRRHRASGKSSTIHVDEVLTDAQLQLEPDGSVLVPVGKKLMRWSTSGELKTLVELPSPVVFATTASGSATITTKDGATYSWPVDGHTPPQGIAPTGTGTISISGDAQFGAFVTPRGIDLVDLVAGVRWSLVPADRKIRAGQAVISRDGKRVAAMLLGTIVVWDLELPMTAADTRSWLDQLTNASADLGASALTWR